MSEKYWLDKMNENPRYREIWEKIKELPFHETTEIILDLEAKLAEREEAIKYLKGIKRYDIGDMLTENVQLKQQLAEKEKEIEEVKKPKTYIMNFGGKVKEVRVLDDNQTAIAELEKVIEFMKTENELGFKKSAMETFMFIDQQIKALKGDQDENGKK